MLEQTLQQLATQLRSERVADRRAAVRQAAELLEQPTCQTDCRERILELLRDLLATESYTTVRDDAQAILNNVWLGVDATIRTDEQRFMIGVRCELGHVSYYDRRRICADESVIMRSRVRAGEREVDEFYVKCREPGCDKVHKLQINCGEYGQ